MAREVTRLILSALAIWCALGMLPSAHGASAPERLLLIIDPSNADSLYVGNYYKHARNVPDTNVIYMEPGATDYSAFADNNLDALFGHLAATGIEDHIDYIVILPGAPFYVSAPGLVSDGCSAVTRFSISSAYTLAFLSNKIKAGTYSSQALNQYYGTTNWIEELTSSTGWTGGVPTSDPQADRYFCGIMLGYTGERGNTVSEIIDLIDRSIAVEGTKPTGTFYYMNNPADPDRNVRVPQYDEAIAKIEQFGGVAEVIGTAADPAILPVGRHDCLGVMTGSASPAIDTADFTLVPGGFCDHLTSWAASFDRLSQVKLSRWIVKGANGSWGAVEEPCNYTGKFPEARVHLYYWRGAAIGEAALRSARYLPFQSLLYGDPLSRPFQDVPAVSVPDAPAGAVSGSFVLTPSATTTHPSTQIVGFDLHIDGVHASAALPGETFTVNTTNLADGWHDLRVLAFDSSPLRRTGSWIGSIMVNNRGRSVTFNALPTSGNLAQQFTFDVTATGGTVHEVRVIQNGRVIAAEQGAAATLSTFGSTLGAGPAVVHAEALFFDGTRVRSAPATLTVDTAAGTPSDEVPVAYGYTKLVTPDEPFLVELPASYDSDLTTLTYAVLSGPAQATVAAGQTGPYRLLRPAAGAHGQDTLTYRVTSPFGDSNEATVQIMYTWTFGDMNCDGATDLFDIDPFVIALTSAGHSTPFDDYLALWPDCDPQRADIDGSGAVDLFDVDPFVQLLSAK